MRFTIDSIDLLHSLSEKDEHRRKKRKPKQLSDRELWIEESPIVADHFFIELECTSEKCNKTERFFDNIISRQFAARILEMRHRLSGTLGSLISFASSSLASLSLLFGLCNSRASYILSAFFGSSLSRIPTV